MILLFKSDFNSIASRNVFFGSNGVDDEVVDELLGLSLFRCSSYSKACMLKLFEAFGLNSMNLRLIKVLELFGGFGA